MGSEGVVGLEQTSAVTSVGHRYCRRATWVYRFEFFKVVLLVVDASKFWIFGEFFRLV